MSGTHRMHGLLLHLGRVPLATRHGELTVDVCQNLVTRNRVLAVSRGDLRAAEPLLARVHSSCVTSEGYGSCDCDCAEQLDAALAHVARAGRGIVFYLMQEGRGAGFVAKVRDRMIVQASGNTLTTFDAYERMGLDSDHRVYDEVASMRRLLGIVAPLRLLTNNPEKVAALVRAGIPLDGTAPLRHDVSPFNAHYLTAKQRSGHTLNGGGGTRAAEPPEPVEYFEPYALAGAPHLIHVASYFVPIALPPAAASPDAGGSAAASADGLPAVHGDAAAREEFDRRLSTHAEGPHWFQLHAYFDVGTGGERVVLAYRRDADAVPLVRLQRESLLERFRVGGGGVHTDAWHATVRAIVARGAGCVAVLAAEQAAAAERAGDDATFGDLTAGAVVADAAVGDAVGDATFGDAAAGDPAVDDAAIDDTAVWLLAHHAPRRAQPLLDRPAPRAGARGTEGLSALARRLERLGVVTEPAISLASAHVRRSPAASPSSSSETARAGERS